MERVAHRGAPRERLENTLPSFLRALELGADAIELDVHLSSDGVVVVHHDESARGRDISATPWRELSTLDLGGATMPRLEDVLAAVGDRAAVYIELKGRDVGPAAIAVALKHGKRFAVHSFDHHVIAHAAQTHPEVDRGVLLDRGTWRAAQALRIAIDRTSARDAWPHSSLVDAAFMEVAEELGVRVIPWTVNSADTARSLRDLGVAGICTDDLTTIANLGA